MFRNVLIGAAAAIVAAAPATSLAAIVSIPLVFTKTGGDPTNVASQLSVLITNADASNVEMTGKVRFRVTNAVGIQSSIAQISFVKSSAAYITTLVAPPTLSDSGADVNFASTSTVVPSLGLPGSFVDFYNAESDNPAVGNGLNQSTDWLDLTFDLTGSNTILNFITEMTTGNVRIGLKIQGSGDRAQDSSQYLSGVPSFTPGIVIVPLPPAMLAGLAMLGGLGLIRARRTRREG
jgi:hypothetical protein